MTTVNMFEAKTNLSRYVASVENGAEPFVVISRGGKPVAKIVPYRSETTGRIGLAEGAVPYLSSLDLMQKQNRKDASKLNFPQITCFVCRPSGKKSSCSMANS